jgi:hypothetical protein
MQVVQDTSILLRKLLYHMIYRRFLDGDFDQRQTFRRLRVVRFCKVQLINPDEF